MNSFFMKNLPAGNTTIGLMPRFQPLRETRMMLGYSIGAASGFKERGMRAFLALVIIAALAAPVCPVFAQDNHVQRYGEEDKEATNAEKAAEKADARAYQKSLGNIPDQGPTDPWGAVRSTDAPKSSAAKPKKTKTGSAAPAK
jgi:hypothetical protein